MIRLLVILVFGMAAFHAHAQTDTFDDVPLGGLPEGWLAGVTGRGHHDWVVVTDPVAPSPPQVLRQRATGTFPWCVKTAVSLSDGFVEAKLRPASGLKDQAGGIVWRWKNGRNYYVARVNALENNIALYYVKSGKRRMIRSVRAPIPRDIWQTLRVEFAGNRITVAWNGRTYIEATGRHIRGAGAVGVWTRRDSDVAFDDFSYGPPPTP